MNKFSENYINHLIRSGLNLNHAPSLVSAGNPANHGFISPLHAKLQDWGLMKKPNISTYAYHLMRTRGEAANSNLASVLGSNPDLEMFGRLGKNRIFQQIYDRITPGGSREDAYKAIIGNFGNSLGGYGLKNQYRNAYLAKNILNNLDSAMAGSDGSWDYSKSHGYNRAEVINNLAAFKRKFG
jgi:hypothetical protein